MVKKHREGPRTLVNGHIAAEGDEIRAATSASRLRGRVSDIFSGDRVCYRVTAELLIPIPAAHSGRQPS